MTNICGHDRETLRWAIKLWANIDNTGQLPFTMGGKVSPDDARNSAFRDANDPAKLAAMLASEGRRLGFDFGSQWDGTQRNEFLVYYEPDRGPMLVIDHLGGIMGVKNTLSRLFGRRVIDMTPARALLLKWLDLQDGAREEAEKALRGGT